MATSFSKETGGLTNYGLQNYYRFATSLIDAYKGLEENTICNLDRLVIQLASMGSGFP